MQRSESLGAPAFQTINLDTNSKAAPPEKWRRQATLPILQGKVSLGYLQVATELKPILGTT